MDRIQQNQQKTWPVPVFGAFTCILCLRSAYQVVVEEERPRRARGTAEILRCYPVPIHFQNATLLNSQYYFTAQFPAGGIHSPQPFTVGDNKTYNGYWNAPLLPQKSYSIYYQAVSTANGVRALWLPMQLHLLHRPKPGFKCGCFQACHFLNQVHGTYVAVSV